MAQQQADNITDNHIAYQESSFFCGPVDGLLPVEQERLDASVAACRRSTVLLTPLFGEHQSFVGVALEVFEDRTPRLVKPPVAMGFLGRSLHPHRRFDGSATATTVDPLLEGFQPVVASVP